MLTWYFPVHIDERLPSSLSSEESFSNLSTSGFTPEFHTLIIDASKWSFIDSTAAREVVSIVSKFQALGVRVLLASATCEYCPFEIAQLILSVFSSIMAGYYGL